jgi:PEGA domain-containing protein
MKRGAAALLLCLLVAGRASADPTSEARSHFTRGVELFKEADFRAALIEFQRAYEAAPNYKVLYNLGQTSFELQDYAGALKAFRGYLDGGGKEISAARVAQVEADIRKLEARVARVEVLVNVEGADVTIDDMSVGRSPLREPILVGAGRRKIAVSKAGLATVTRVIDVAGGDKPRITIELTEPPKPTAQTVIVEQPLDQPAQQQPQERVRVVTGPSTGFWIGLVVTSACAVGAGVLGGIALASYNTYESKLSQVGVQFSDVDGARNQTRSFALATDIVGAAAIVGAITTFVLAFTTNSKREVREKALVIGPGFVSGRF